MKRRNFLQGITLAGAAVLSNGLLTNPIAKAVANQSANDRIGVGIIGAGGMGSGDASLAAQFGEIVAIADADLAQAERMKQRFDGKPVAMQDYRKLLERKDVDVVIQATPDHWHTKINIDACLAGKDVYGEKPLSLTVTEGRKLCQVVKETKRVFQTGTQQRSGREFQTAVELVRNGRIGKLKQVLVSLPYYNTKGGPFETMPVPSTLDWELYQGQAPVHDYTQNRTHANFRWWYEYAGGIVTDWGNHHIDIAHWGMDAENTGPTSIEARGIFPNNGHPKCYNTPDRFFSRMLFANGVELLYFISLAQREMFGGSTTHSDTTQEEQDWLFGEEKSPDVRESKRDGILFIGETGRVFVNRGGLYGRPVEELEQKPLPDNAWRVRPSSDHMKNFFDCVRTRELPVGNVDIEQRSVSTCHLTNISIRLGGRKLTWNPDKEQFVGDAEANAMLQREQRAPYQI